LVITDLVALLVAAWLGFTAGPSGSGPVVVATVVVIAWLLSLASVGTHNPCKVGHGTAELRRVVGASARVALVVLAVAYLGEVESARSLVLVTLPAGTGLLLLGRAGIRVALALSRKRSEGAAHHRVIAVGTVRDVLHLIEQAEGSPRAGFHVVGACVPAYVRTDRREVDRRGSTTDAAHLQQSGDRRAESDRRGDVAELAAAGVPVLGTPDEVLGAVAGKRADSVVVAGQGLMSRHGLRRLAWQLQSTDTGLFLASQLSDVAAPRITVRTLSGLPLLQVQAPVFDGGQRRFKSLMDRLLAAALLLAFAPVLVVVAALVGLSSPGGVLYRQERIGLGQRPFRCLKFRTMYSGADSAAADLRSQGDTDGPLFKMRTDPRVTPVGQVLRRFSLDELPQLFNVLGGSMSLVGPRPPLPDEVAEYGHDVRRRLLVKPGMTGLWQVSGRSDLTWAESVRLDLYYVENWSPLLDLQIIARTAIAVAGGRGAY
jgi:lipopolysaccharide/colanic/teichoic acid biosynthesis glycosyltransferase